MRREWLARAGFCVLVAVLASGCVGGTLAEEEKGHLLTVEDLAGFGVKAAEPERFGKFRKTSYLDFSKDLEYEYEIPDGVTVADPLYLSCTISLERSVADARSTYFLQEKTVTTVGKWRDLGIEEKKDFFRWGDAAKFALFVKNGKPVGNLFVGRKGKVVYFVCLSGVYFDDPKLWAKLMEPKLQGL
jgi:hypothetical protein